MIKYFLFLSLVAILLSCKPADKSPKTDNKEWSNGHSVSYHKEVNEREQLSISLYLEQHPELKKLIKTTETGLRYAIISTNEKGNYGNPGQTASLILNVSLLDGTPCYKTEEAYYDECPIDRNDRESGLNEVLKLMRVGETAKLILPNHLAHGMIGDLENIPPLAILLVTVELKELR
jgi:FKBP-type peptidyl-prolyl cis-trans isomerase